MSMVKQLTNKLGEGGMKKSATRDELYHAVDLITDTLKSHKERIDLLEGKKPRVRVQAGSERT